HQIRALMAFIVHPILGDKIYCASTLLANREIALYAHCLVFEHPITKEEITIESPTPSYWPKS
ncbi:MAG: RluA family pseudouridine synthase, partial [Nitrospinales bacterium]|nr:RluA family pseudouridine synthase [Nitrospinales bacterium]